MIPKELHIASFNFMPINKDSESESILCRELNTIYSLDINSNLGIDINLYDGFIFIRGSSIFFSSQTKFYHYYSGKLIRKEFEDNYLTKMISNILKINIEKILL